MLPESTLMFATFSPDGTRVAWVRQNNLYVEDLASEKITQLTSDGSDNIINGTSDWVNEEELFLRNCFRWSPDGRAIAYWQFDQSGVSEYTLINDTGNEYPSSIQIQIPAARHYEFIRPRRRGAGRRRRHTVDQARGRSAPALHCAHGVGGQFEAGARGISRSHAATQPADACRAHTGDAKLFFEDSDKAWVDVVPLTFIGKERSQRAGPALAERARWMEPRVSHRSRNRPAQRSSRSSKPM